MAEQKTILVAEDEKPMAKALELKLTSAGFKVELAGDGEEAIAKITSAKPDLILLDLMMPKVDGFKVLEDMKANKNNTSVIVLTNLSQEEDKTRVKALGAKGFIVKSETPIADIIEEVKKMF